MDGIAVNPAADANPEPQSMQAGSVGACTPVETASLPDPTHLTDPVSIDVRGLGLAIVTTVVVVFALQWAEKFLYPSCSESSLRTPLILSWCGWSG